MSVGCAYLDRLARELRQPELREEAQVLGLPRRSVERVANANLLPDARVVLSLLDLIEGKAGKVVAAVVPWHLSSMLDVADSRRLTGWISQVGRGNGLAVLNGFAVASTRARP